MAMPDDTEKTAARLRFALSFGLPNGSGAKKHQEGQEKGTATIETTP